MGGFPSRRGRGCEGSNARRCAGSRLIRGGPRAVRAAVRPLDRVQCAAEYECDELLRLPWPSTPRAACRICERAEVPPTTLRAPRREADLFWRISLGRRKRHGPLARLDHGVNITPVVCHANPANRQLITHSDCDGLQLAGSSTLLFVTHFVDG